MWPRQTDQSPGSTGRSSTRSSLGALPTRTLPTRTLPVGSVLIAAVLIGAVFTSAGCAGPANASTGAAPEVVRLGYFPTVTHAPALVALAEGTFAANLGDTRLQAVAFNAGPEVVESLFAGALDMAYVGPNPAINAFHRSEGRAVRIVSGSTSGGAALVVRPGIDDAEDLRGVRIATPQLGNSQDVALRVWLREQGLQTDTSGGGDTSVVPQPNADTLNGFRSGSIDAAWVPEPWVSRLVLEGGGRILVDESDLWPDGRHATAQILVRTEFLDEHPDTVAAVLRGHLDALDAIATRSSRARAAANDQIAAVTGKDLPDDVLRRAWEHLEFTSDPLVGSLRGAAEDAEDTGFLTDVDLRGIHDLRILESIAPGRPR